MRLGIDIGSTTIKYVVLDDAGRCIDQDYQRHSCQITEKLIEVLQKVSAKYNQPAMALAVSGSAAMGLQEKCSLPFVQEVYATRIAATKRLEEVDCIIELGGEDAKILFLSGGLEVRMNGTCAGGTGAFIDQMATLLNLSAEEMNEAAKQAEKIYTIASRCGVFAKSDIQPLINQGADKEDLAASIYQAVVNQTIQGLAQGRKIEGHVVYLGEPLTFNSELRAAFDKTLKLTGVCPENSLYYVAIGTALLAEEPVNFADAIKQLQTMDASGFVRSLPPLFADEDEYRRFSERHQRNQVRVHEPKEITGRCALGIDAGSTTVKMVLINEQEEILYSMYQPNQGNALQLVREALIELMRANPRMEIVSSCVTGYGEDLIRSAFGVDAGIVETMAHFTASRKYMPDVDFIIDIGGQDIKCFKIHNGTIDNIFLNEACSSGCGSFLQTFANALGYEIEDFSRLGLFAKHPVDLGSRCTVFMNSSVKQAQKDGATIDEISAGLSISVVKNALYKVIRTADARSLGKHIITQGGTFYNDAVLRAFEQELDTKVIRPNIAGLMGAYGCALHALRHCPDASSLLNLDQLEHFHNEIRYVQCGLCNNHCRLTVNQFSDGRKYIGGNRCERPVTKKSTAQDLNIYAVKRELLSQYKPVPGPRGKIGLPLALNMMELLPFWHTFFTELGFEVVTSGFASLEKYQKAQNSIPSDTICFPAKLVHAAIQSLLDQQIPAIFYPCMTYNMREKNADNNYNCPVVAYYPEVIAANMQQVTQCDFIYDYVGIHRQKNFPVKVHKILSQHFRVGLREVIKASKKAYEAYDQHLETIRQKGQEIITQAQLDDREIIVLAGRPYHADPLVSHDIDKLITSYGAAVISEDVINEEVGKKELGVWNQWTYHSRLYAAARYVATQEKMNLVQLVSFGCGVDAITTDEVREILEEHGKIYTQIKIDEITNLGAVKIRLRSLFAALKQEDEHHD